MPAQQPISDALSTKHLHADLKGRSVRGGLLTVSSQGAQFLIQTVATVVLARLLTPTDFGLVAMVTSVTGLASAFVDLGLTEATIQSDDLNQAQVSALFWINVAIGVTLTLLTVALGPVLAWIFREPRLVHIAFLISLTFLISGLRSQHEALLKRQMRYLSLAARDAVSLAIAVAISIAMARHGAGYWALVALPIITNSGQMVFSWLMVRWIPGWPRRGAKVGSLLAFGGNVALSYFIITVIRSADNVLIGWYWGAGPLGFYSRAYNLLMLPVRQLSAPAASVTIPAFSRIREDQERFARYYLRAVNLIMWMSAPLFGFLFVAAEPVIILVLGNQWREAAPVFQILAICGLGHMLLESTIWLLVSRGQSNQLFRLLLVISPIIVGSFAVGLPFGIKGVALSGSVVLIAILPWILKFAFRGTTLTLRQLALAILYPISMTLGGIFLAELTLHLFAPKGLLPHFLIIALGFTGSALLAALVPPVREEFMSFRRLAGDLRQSA
jgi:O-antigen/teichoic acid export membrane protein